MITQLLSGKALAALAAATILSGGAAAAATGSLPDPVQSTVSNSLSHVGVDVPNPDHVPDTNNSDTNRADSNKPEQTPVGPDATGPAHAGLCTARNASASA